MIALKKKKQFSEFTEGQNFLSQFCRVFGQKNRFQMGKSEQKIKKKKRRYLIQLQEATLSPKQLTHCEGEIEENQNSKAGALHKSKL